MVFTRGNIFVVVSFLLFIFQSYSQGNEREIDSLKKLIDSNCHDTIKINAYKRWDNLIYANDPAMDLKLNNEIIELSKTKLQKTKSKKLIHFYSKALSSSLRNVASYYADQGDYENALKNYELSRQTGIKVKDLTIQSLAFMGMSRAMRYKGDIMKAIEYAAEGIQLEEKVGNGKGTGVSYNLMGNLYRTIGDFPKSLVYFQKALTASELAKDDKEKGSSLLNYGLVYYELSDYEKANQYYLKSFHLFKSINFDRGVSIVLTNLANIKQQLQQYDSALIYYEKGLEVIRKQNDFRSEAGVLNNIGMLQTRKGNYAKAIEFISQSMEIREKGGDEIGQSICFVLLGEVYITMKQFGKAIDFCKKGLLLSEKTESLPEQRDNCKCLYVAYKGSGNMLEALKYHEKYISLKDTLTNSEKADEIARLDERYKFRKTIEADSIRNIEKEKIQKAETEKQKALADRKDVELNGKKKEQYFLFGGLAAFLVFSIILFNRFKASQKQKKLIEIKEHETREQKLIIEEKQKEIIDSINYAKRIQYALLAHDELLKDNLSEYFVFFKPKDIVSGDFYWGTFDKASVPEEQDSFYLAVCDSTGHGVPGAFMSLLNISFLNEAINEKNIKEPHLVFNHVRQRLMENMEEGKDGMDAQIIRITENKIQYSAAHNRPLLIRNKLVTELNADKMPVGRGEKMDSFQLYEMEIQKGDLLILLTDGFADQFGGPKGKKFKSTQFQKMILENSTLPLSELNSLLMKGFDSWKGELEQIDDVCIIGIKF